MPNIQYYMKIVKAYDSIEAKKILRNQYGRITILTYQFVKNYKHIDKEKRNYKNRKMKVWFIKDVDKCLKIKKD